MLTIKTNRRDMARYGLNVSDVQEIIEIADCRQDRWSGLRGRPPF